MEKVRIRPSAPVYQNVRALIVKEIAAGGLSEGAYLPSERKICELLGVSRDTVRKALAELEKEGLIVRGTGKRPLVGGGGMSGNGLNSKTVAVISGVPFSEIFDDRYTFLSGALQRLAKRLDAASLSIFYVNPGLCGLDPKDLMDGVNRGGYAGLVYFSGSGAGAKKYLEWLEKAPFPAVAVEEYLDEQALVSTVELDSRHGAFLAVKHLLDYGHRKIAHLTFDDPGKKWIDDRIEGVRQALSEAGMEFSSSMLFRTGKVEATRVVGDWVKFPELFKRVMDSGATAVFAANDVLAASFSKFLKSMGKSVPADVSLVGFDNIGVEIDTPLTTVSHMTAEIGDRVAELIIKKRRPDNASTIFRERIKPVLVSRDSVARIG